MARTAGNGHQNIRRLENEAIAKAEKYIKRVYTSRSANHPNKDKHHSHTDSWKYKLVNGKWQLMEEQPEQTSA